MRIPQLKRRNQIFLAAMALLMVFGIVMIASRFMTPALQEAKDKPAKVKIVWLNIFDENGNALAINPIPSLREKLSCSITDFPINLEIQKDILGNWNVDQNARTWQLEQERRAQELLDSSQ